MILKLRPDPPIAWRIAIEAWTSGNKSQVLALLGDDRPIPAFARVWIADALSGRVKMKRGRKRVPRAGLKAYRQIQINGHYQRVLLIEQAAPRQYGDGTPSERALAITAERYGMSPDAVSHIVHLRKPQGA